MSMLGVIVRVREEYLVAWCNEVNFVGIHKNDVKDLWSMGTCEWVRMQVEELEPQYVPEEGVNHFASSAVPADPAEVPSGLRFRVHGDTIKVVGARLRFMEQRYVESERRLLDAAWAPVMHDRLWMVAAPTEVYSQIRPVQDYFDATIILEPPAQDERFPWRVSHFCLDSVEHTLPGYMCVIGHGRWQRESLRRRSRSSQPDTDRHSNATVSTAVNGTFGLAVSDGATERSNMVMLPAVTTMPQKKRRPRGQSGNRGS